jgi:glycosyltransferase involved in cell wall biosynthesis
MRVLWFSPTPSMYDEGKVGGWVASLELAIRMYQPDIELAIAFDSAEAIAFKVKKENVTYYPMRHAYSLGDCILMKFGAKVVGDTYIDDLMRVVNDFGPDIIQCFGSEWPYGQVAEYTNIPVVIHMQGFLNIYNLSASLALSRHDARRCNRVGPKWLYHALFDWRRSEAADVLEREIMSKGRFFMGRTEWDRDIVRYFSPGAEYFHCEEALRPAIYCSENIWRWTDGTPRIITVTQAGTLKGNEMILRTAKILKEVFHFDFTWRVAGNRESFIRFERKTGISCEDVGIELLGMIPAEQVVEELSAARVYVHPAIIDNSPNSLCEAQTLGCPVIATYAGGIPSMVQDGETGFLYPYDEPYALAFKIMGVTDDREKLEYISAKERTTALARHAPQAIAERVMEIYRRILKV